MDASAKQTSANIQPEKLRESLLWIANYSVYSVAVFEHINPTQAMVAFYFHYLVAGNDAAEVEFLCLVETVLKAAPSYIKVWFRDDFKFIREDVAEALSTLARISVRENISVHSPLVSYVTCLEEKYLLFGFFTQYVREWACFIGRLTPEIIADTFEYGVGKNDTAIATITRNNVDNITINGNSLMYTAVFNRFVEAAVALSAAKAPWKYKEVNKLLDLALDTDDSTMVQILAKAGVDLSFEVKCGYGYLHIAAELGKIAMVEALIDAGVRVDMNINNSYTPLYYASINGNLSVVQLLLQKGANVNAGCVYGTPIHGAVQYGCPRVVKVLCEAGANPNSPSPGMRNLLHDAVRDGDALLVEELIAAGADPCIKERLDYHSPLHIAAMYQNIEIVSILLASRGTEVDSKDKEHRTPLHLAAEVGFLEGVEALIEAGAEVNAKDICDERSPLHFAARNGHWRVIALLYAKGADVNCRDRNDETPLGLARRGKNVKTVKVLLSKGAVY